MLNDDRDREFVVYILLSFVNEFNGFLIQNRFLLQNNNTCMWSIHLTLSFYVS